MSAVTSTVRCSCFQLCPISSNDYLRSEDEPGTLDQILVAEALKSQRTEETVQPKVTAPPAATTEVAADLDPVQPVGGPVARQPPALPQTDSPTRPLSASSALPYDPPTTHDPPTPQPSPPRHAPSVSSPRRSPRPPQEPMGAGGLATGIVVAFSAIFLVIFLLTVRPFIRFRSMALIT